MNKNLISFILVLTSIQIHAGGINIDRLTTHAQEALAIVEGYPCISWTMKSDENNTRQTGYEVDIREKYTRRSVWNSGKVISSQNHLVYLQHVGLPQLPQGVTYSWRVRAWDEKDIPSAWSADADFRIAPEKFIDAQWVGAITRKDSRLPEGRKFGNTVTGKPEVKALWNAVDTLSGKSISLRKAFHAVKNITEATVYVCGLGNYELSLNGMKVGDGEFTPLWSDFDKTVYYNTYDVTSYLAKGENVAGVLLGNGFYNVQGGRYVKLKGSFGPPTLFFQLHLHYADGTHEVVNSGADWKYTLSPVTFNCIYGGENYDARLEQKGWDKPGFNDAAWKPVVVQEAPKGVLRPQTAPPVKIMERYGVRRVTKLTPAQVDSATVETKRTVDPSAFVLDMGQNLAGFPEITVRGRKGQKITLLVAESLTKDGAANQKQTGRQHYYEYTLKGEGEEVWRPRFTYYGFRYIQVEGAVMPGEKNTSKLPVLKKINSCFIYNSARKVSTFETSNPLFNAAHRLIEKAVRSNMQANFTDCPHREKLGWLEEVHLNGPGLLYNYDLRSYTLKVMQDIADAQQPNGMIPSIAPQYVVFEGKGMDDFLESPEWGSTFILFPFMYRDAYGDDSLIKKYYRQMRAYVDYLTSRADNHIVSFGLGDWYDYGDFRAGFSRNTPVPLVATAHYYADLMYMTEAAHIIGNVYDESFYSALADQVNRAFNERFLNRETSQYGTGSQCSNALPLFFGMTKSADNEGNLRLDEKLHAEVLANLVKDIKAHGNRLTTGDVGNRYLFQALVRNNLNELLNTMIDHYDAPGYGFQLQFDATTLTEQWDPRMGASWNHFMMGQIDEWFFNSLAGINTEVASGYKEIIIRPQVVGDLKAVKASTETPYGEVKVDWKREDNRFTIQVSVPVNAVAKVYLPGDGGVKEVNSGMYTFTCNLNKI